MPTAVITITRHVWLHLRVATGTPAGGGVYDSRLAVSSGAVRVDLSLAGVGVDGFARAFGDVLRSRSLLRATSDGSSNKSDRRVGLEPTLARAEWHCCCDADEDGLPSCGGVAAPLRGGPRTLKLPLQAPRCMEMGGRS